MRWLVTVVLLVVLAFVGYRYFYPDEGQQGTAQAEQAGAAANVDLRDEIGTSVNDTVSALEEITDRASAEAALPSLQAVEIRLDELSGSVEQLSEEGRRRSPRCSTIRLPSTTLWPRSTPGPGSRPEGPARPGRDCDRT